MFGSSGRDSKSERLRRVCGAEVLPIQWKRSGDLNLSARSTIRSMIGYGGQTEYSAIHWPAAGVPRCL